MLNSFVNSVTQAIHVELQVVIKKALLDKVFNIRVHLQRFLRNLQYKFPSNFLMSFSSATKKTSFSCSSMSLWYLSLVCTVNLVFVVFPFMCFENWFWFLFLFLDSARILYTSLAMWWIGVLL